MPIEYQIDHNRKFVSAKAHGPVVLDEIVDYLDAVAGQDAMPYPKLFDAREAEPKLNDDDVMMLGARVSAYAAYDPRGSLAAVTANKETIEILQRYMNLGGPDLPMQLFTSIEEARAWLGLD